MAEEEGRGFLGRWSRRKADAAQGKPLEESLAPARQPPAPPETARTEPAELAPPPDNTPAAPQKLLTVEDARSLTKDSDFKPFMASGVGPDVRNAAMKQLFADPHFNVMDGLDIYIDDYSKADPIPEAMLRKMQGAQFLKLFDDKDEAVPAETAAAPVQAGSEGPSRENANGPDRPTVAHSYENTDISAADPSGTATLSPSSSQPEPASGSGASHQDHANTDLRLQPDDAAPAPDAGHGTR